MENCDVLSDSPAVAEQEIAMPADDRRADALRNALERPIFLVGAERSGTTLLRLMLDHHPDVAWCEEFEFVVDRVGDDGTPPSPAAYREYLSGDRIFQLSKFEIDPTLDYRSLIRSFLAQAMERGGKRLVGATVHRHYGRLRHLWPHARFIHLLRDGRDVARSCIGMGWAGNVWTGADRWIEAEATWAQVKAVLDPLQYHEVRYESLVRAPRENIETICTFLGVAYSNKMLEYANTSTYERPDPKLVGQWRTKLALRDIRLVEARIGPMLRQRGYDLSGFESQSIGPLRCAALRLQDKWARTQFRLKRFGAPLLAADFLSRRLGMTGWQKRLRPRINAIQNAHLR